MQATAHDFAKEHELKLLVTKGNSISMAMHFPPENPLYGDSLTQLGAILYSKRVMGHRVVSASARKTKIVGVEFSNYGSHHEAYPCLPYITFACAVGTQKEEVIKFFGRFA